MKTRELILVLIIVGYLLANLSFLVIEYSITFENNKDKPIQMVELFGNGTTRSFEIENPSPDPDVFTSIFAAGMRVAFALPFAIAGLGLISAPIGFLQTRLFVPPEGFHVLVFWIMAMITIPINYMFTKNIPLWRRIPYIYLLAAIISGTPMLLNENFGR
ncbi:hypothetical protein [Nitrosopumilus ureiphilus]|uniref:Uncharacterized protein n=1 Tax=Nitrosopumilus ureiphilus TaxID=1470067 RepID=A0A7D5RGY8_9ARCH|nr:hypothetical protein [Nitrosopumilus ureiphilus]QLH07365.1 hypothetical protein C5F50_10005 [Nitrosopumilus ureiphilus]